MNVITPLINQFIHQYGQRLTACFLLCCMAVFPVQALERGDKVPEHIAEQMALDPNKITVVDFFASWCVSCRIELPEINELSQHLNDPQVAFVGVEVDEELVLAEQFLAQMQLKFPVVMDQNQQVISAFEPLGMPALYYVYNNQILGVRFGAIPDIGQVVINDLATLRGQ